MQISTNGVELIKEFEGLYLKSYRDSVGVWTIAYGRINYDDGRPVRANEACTKEQAEKWLTEDIEKEGSHFVRAYLKKELKQCEFDALSSFCFNRGAGRLKELVGMGVDNIAQNILRFDYAGKPPKILPGLTRRRYAEREMFCGGDWRLFSDVNTWRSKIY